MSFVRQVAFQMVNIALRQAYAFPLSENARINFFREFFANESNKLWTFIMYCAMSCDTLARNPILYQNVPFHTLQTDRAQTGLPTVNNPMLYTSHANDNQDQFQYLAGFMADKPSIRDFMLRARADWNEMYRTDNMDPPDLPAIRNRKALVESLAKQMDTNFKTNVVTHFIARTQAFIAAAMTTIADIPDGWPELVDEIPLVPRQFNEMFYHTIIQGVNAANAQNFRQQIMTMQNQMNGEADVDLVESAVTFVNRLRNKRLHANIHNPINYIQVQEELREFAKRPREWPNHNALPLYILANIFYIPFLYADASVESIIDDNACREVHQLVLGLEPPVQREIKQFIRDLRLQLENAAYNWHIGIRVRPLNRNQADDSTSREIPIDIFDCLGLPRPSLIQRTQHLFVDVEPEDPHFARWEQNWNGHWITRLRESVEYFDRELLQLFARWDRANRLTGVRDNLQNNQVIEMEDLHVNVFEGEWEAAGVRLLNRQQRFQVMLDLLENFYQKTMNYIHGAIYDEICRWYSLWDASKSYMLELRDVLYDVHDDAVLQRIQRLNDIVEQYQQDIDRRWREEMDLYTRHVRQMDQALLQRYQQITNRIPNVLPRDENGEILDTPAVQAEYNFWRDILHERYLDFERFCVNIQEPVYNVMIDRTNNFYDALEDIQVAIHGILVLLEDDLEQAEENQEAQEDEDPMIVEEEEEEDRDMDQAQEESSNGFRSHALIPMLAMMLDRYPDQLSFRLCPMGQSGAIFIPVNSRIGKEILQNIDYFAQGLPNYEALGPEIRTLQDCVKLSRLTSISGNTFAIPLPTATRRTLHDIITESIARLMLPQHVAPLYDDLPNEVDITDLHQQMILMTREFGGGGLQDEDGNLIFNDNTRARVLYASQLYCNQMLIIRMLRIRTLLRCRIITLHVPGNDLNATWTPPLFDIDVNEWDRMLRAYNGYYNPHIGLDDFTQAYVHCYNRVFLERLITIAYNANNQIPLQVSTIGEYLDQWQSGNLAVTRNHLIRNWDPYAFLISPEYHSSVSIDGNVAIKHSKYYRDLHQTIPGVDNIVYPRYTIERLMTDGVQLKIVMRDWGRRSTRFTGNPVRYIPEVRKKRHRLLEESHLRPDQPVNIRNINNELNQRIDLLRQRGYRGVIGIDLGETYAAGAFYLPQDGGTGVQTTIKRNELYGRTRNNASMLEHETRRLGIDDITSQLSRGSTTSDLQSLNRYIQNFQVDNHGITLNNFYSRRSFLHRRNSNRLSMKSALDKACSRVLSMNHISTNAPDEEDHRRQIEAHREPLIAYNNVRMVPWEQGIALQRQILQQEQELEAQATQRRLQRIERRQNMTPQQREQRAFVRRMKRRRQRRRPRPSRIVVALGMDGMREGNQRRGALASMDLTFATKLNKIASSKGCLVVRCDEYMTSKMCPRCAMDNITTRMEYLTVPIPGTDQHRQSIRVLVCDRCQVWYHRDGAAAHNIANNSTAYLRYGQRVPINIRRSRRVQGFRYQ